MNLTITLTFDLDRDTCLQALASYICYNEVDAEYFTSRDEVIGAITETVGHIGTDPYEIWKAVENDEYISVVHKEEADAALTALFPELS